MSVGNIIYSTSSTTIASGDKINATDFERSTNLQVDDTSGNLNISGGINTSGTSNLGSVDSVKISGGSSGQVLSTDGSSNLSWVSSSSSLTVKATSSYTSSGTSTWTKASGATGDTVVAVVIGGGGGGAYALFVADPYGGGSYSSSTGGGGGGVAVIAMPYEDCPSTVSVSVGAGGAARTSQGNGNNGSTSSFGNFAKATGGTGGISTGIWSGYLRPGGIGGGPLFGNSSNNADYPTSEVVRDIAESGIRNGGAGRASPDVAGSGYSLSYTSLIPAGLTGGGGSVFYNGTTWYAQNSTGGTGRIFGDGGSGQTSGAAATAGVAPGGGGGGSATGNSGAGAVGAVYIYIVAGFVSASTILDRASSNKYTISF
jgi:hypothetical protein